MERKKKDQTRKADFEEYGDDRLGRLILEKLTIVLLRLCLVEGAVAENEGAYFILITCMGENKGCNLSVCCNAILQFYPIINMNKDSLD